MECENITIGELVEVVKKHEHSVNMLWKVVNRLRDGSIPTGILNDRSREVNQK